MDSGALLMVVAIVLALGSLLWVIFTMLRSIRDEKSGKRSVWREFGLSIALMTLFFATWIGHGIAEWQSYTDQQREHNEPVEVGDFVNEFATATLENWQSEFLQLFAFVSLAALYIHKGSAESKDGEERLEASLRRIEQQLGTLPPNAPKKTEESWKLPETPLEMEDQAK